MVSADSLSVDTPKDLEKVRKIISEKIEMGEIVL
jgi:CMP-2-keto-3-deoxyoctulosonic acid synthetase